VSIRSRLEKLERHAEDDFCDHCMRFRFRSEGEPGYPVVCSVCGRRYPEDYLWPDGSPKVREIFICSAREGRDGGDAEPPTPGPQDQAGAVARVPTGEADTA
jgi:hypothetical protein